MGDDLSVGLRANPVAFSHQRLSKLPVVLDDAVMDDGQLAAAVQMRMRIGVRWPPVSGPPGVADADCSAGTVRGQQALEFDDLADALPDFESPSEDRGDSGRVIAAVLKPSKACQDEGNGFLVAGVADDSTHRRTALTRLPDECSPGALPRCAGGD